ncbi:putative asparagine synthase [Dioszegia hungarica]|uniref:asparagine synthase (glutamine-hydrolyzing) n=1 Tax=Dioszegia hungarica TaxID=4972 RepID=A0AA38LSM8_9TREE|nr:putative asparagine synthase [Dioszegia hungarica]KAI9632744.1 putative asparagine synthase [Dioszegia hungarica]
MCGIFCCYNRQGDLAQFRPRAIALSKLQRHRGPDWSGCYMAKDTVLVHERLAIVGVDTGAQPLVSDDETTVLAVNGEIYNHVALKQSLAGKYDFKTHSDCEVIMYLYKEHGTDLCNMLDGMFSFVLLDTSVTPSRLIAARDPIGITTLYMGFHSSAPDTLFFASEMKCIQDECDNLIAFPPGHFYDSNKKEMTRYYNPSWLSTDVEAVPTNPADLELIRTKLEEAVRKRLMSEVPYGVLLSGGLDSSLIASIAARETDRMAEQHEALRRERKKAIDEGRKPEGDEPIASWPSLHSFAVGLVGSPDLLAARKAADFLGTVHHEYTFTVQEGLDAIPEVIHHLETFDVTTVRASTPMYLLSRKIKAMGVKMVLSGEGADEVFGGYLYFHAAPNAEDFHRELIKRVKNLHTADCLRANKSTMAWGLEARVPFLDKSFLEVSMNIDAKHKTYSKGAHQEVDADGKPRMEKYILRKAFDCAPGGKAYLPDSILWRQKEQFSDGVGYSWIDGMKAHAEEVVSEEMMQKRGERFPFETPDTKEAYWIRELFEGQFPTQAAAGTAVRWIPKQEWGVSSDPSGRAVSIHTAAYEGK